MRGTTTRSAMPAGWWTLRTSWSKRDCSHAAQLRHRHRLLLGIYLGRGRVANAGPAALLPPRLYAIHAGLSVPALRNRRHRRQSRRRLAGAALRYSAHAGGGPNPADRGPGHAVAARSRLE